MRKPGGSFGMLILLVVVAVVLYLAGKAWNSVAPTAKELDRSPSTHEAQSGIKSGEAPPLRPSLDEMQKTTSSHTADVDEALREAH